MSNPERTWTDEEVEQIVGNLLRWGVILAATVTAIGGLGYLLQHGADPRPDYTRFEPEPELRGLSGIVRLFLAGRSRGIIEVGVLLLIATPVARVAFSVFAFMRERDYTYVIVTLIVLTAVLYSFVHGLF
jgi:uncharacterized membrane protein